MSIILPGQDDMRQRVAAAEQQDRQIKAVVGQIQNQILVSVFTRLALDHMQSGEPLTIEAGRELAKAAGDAAGAVSNGYAGFLFELLGIAEVNKVDKPEEVV